MIRVFVMAAILVISTVEAAYTFKEGKFIQDEELATMSVQEHHGSALIALHDKNWEELLRQATIITKNFPGTPFACESHFFLAQGYYAMKELDLANRHTTLYLKKQGISKHFEEAMELKLSIAEEFRRGTKKHLIGVKFLPKWVSASEDAVKIYDEIAAAMPNHELAAKALLGKALLLFEKAEFKGVIESLQTLIRRFPKNTLAADAFLAIQRSYLKEVQEEFPNTDLLDLARINLNKFATEFPNDLRLEVAESVMQEMQEFFARQMMETAHFFERTKKPKAALIYYARIVRDFPKTEMARQAQVELKKCSIPVVQIPAQDTAVVQSEQILESFSADEMKSER